MTDALERLAERLPEVAAYLEALDYKLDYDCEYPSIAAHGALTACAAEVEKISEREQWWHERATHWERCAQQAESEAVYEARRFLETANELAALKARRCDECRNEPSNGNREMCIGVVQLCNRWAAREEA
jgi:hypothetical protein